MKALKSEMRMESFITHHTSYIMMIILDIKVVACMDRWAESRARNADSSSSLLFH